MVGRSKPQKKMDPKPSVDFNSAEILYLKAKNLELAKAVADSKAAYTQIVEDRVFLQRELYTMNLRCIKLENYIKNMESASRGCMSSIVMASNHATELLQNAHNALRLKIVDENAQSVRNSTMNGSAHSSPASNKTQAVKPMIGGHVILRPTINLRRVNEIPIEEIQRLQSGSQTQNANRPSDNNISSSENQNDENSTTHVRMFRNHHQPVESVMESFSNNEVEDEYTDQTSDISDPISEANNALDTVQEEREDELSTDNHLLANTNNTSLNLTGSGSQVPLLSGVFRDVRVYLSPMQNVAQYLDPRQHVTTERGSSRTHRPKRSHSMHSARSTENVPKSSSENRKPSATSINPAQNQANSTASSSASLEDSFTSTLQNSLLSSTRIATPKRMHGSASKPDHLNWLGASNNCEDSRLSQNLFGESNGFGNVTNSKYGTVKQKRTWNRIVSRTPDLSSSSQSGSSSKPGPSTPDYDPLEGPSNMLDSFDDETKNKIETMSGLGLTPTFLDNSKQSTEPPPSPARTVLQRRERRKSDEKTKKSLYVTKRSAIEKKKASVVSTKVAKVVVKRLSLSKSRLSGSPCRSLDSSQRGSSLDSSQKNNSQRTKTKNVNNREKESKLNSSSTSLASMASSSASTSSIAKAPPKKRGRKSKQEITDLQNSKKKKSVSPIVSPRKRGRPKRVAGQASLKEPSLRNKLRRSK